MRNNQEQNTETEAHLRRIAQEVFLLMLDIELQPSIATDELQVRAKLCYNTPAGVELELLCDRPLAYAATQRLLSLETIPVEVDDTVRDSVGEIINMVGGNFHSILSPGKPLDTTPRLAESDASEGRQLWVEACFRSKHGAMRLRLSEAAA